MIRAIRARGTLIANVSVLLVLLVGVYHVGFNIMRLQIGRDPFPVTLQMPTSGGLYERSEVTYRGKLVGQVADIRLVGSGVEVKLRIDKGTKIPADLDAVVANLSPAGEQFVDLRPRVVGGPLLRAGSVITADRSTVPVPVATVVKDVATLLDQIGTKELRVIVSELAEAFGGTGPALREIVESADRLVAAAAKDLPAFKRVLSNGRTNLDTANDLSGQFERFNTALRGLSRELRQGTPNVEGLLRDSPGFVSDLNSFITTLSTPIAALLGNLITPGSLIAARLPALNALLIAFPQATAALRTVARDGKFRTELHLTSNPACQYPGPRRTPIDPTRTPPNLTRVCTDTSPGVGARGAQNAPRSTPSGPGSGAGAAAAATIYAGYDPATGVLLLPDGSRLRLGTMDDTGAANGAMALFLGLLRP
ncbi:MAG: MCE family protein [Sporichthyaceae bacterium]